MGEVIARSLIFVALLLLSSLIVAEAFAGDTQVDGYSRKDGTYVQPHFRSAPDSNPSNNWSTKGNMNPYTGQSGTKNSDSSSGYGSSSRGGYGSGEVSGRGARTSNPYNLLGQ